MISTGRVRKHRQIKKRINIHLKDVTLTTAAHQMHEISCLSSSVNDSSSAEDVGSPFRHAGSVSDSNSDTSESQVNSCESEDILYDMNSEHFVTQEYDAEFGTVDNDNGNWHVSQSDSDIDFEPVASDMDEGLIGRLAAWATDNNISQVALGELLKILNNYHKLPKDPRTVLKTRRATDIKLMTGQDGSSGEYVYFGIEKQLQRCLENDPELNLELEDCIRIMFNVDGLPLFKSSSVQFWPVLGKICLRESTMSAKRVFAVAIFCGKSKPASVDEYLHDFVNELCVLKATGLHFHGRHFKVDVLGFVCDAPARAFVKCIKGHTGYYGCEKCVQRGRHVEGKLTFPDVNATKRTNETFAKQTNDEHHKGVSPLISAGIGLVTDFPLDYMHLVCLGIMKRLILYWLRGDNTVRVSAREVSVWSDTLSQFAPFVCSEFIRKPRSFADIDRWKGVELRNFLLYFGPLLLRSNISDKMYHHFMLLSVAIRILSSTLLCHSLRPYAATLLCTFVLELQEIYGAASLVYNMHSVIHLPDDVAVFGVLDSFSCFPFESKLGHIKKQLRSGSRPLAQFCRRLSELEFAQGNMRGCKSVASTRVAASTGSVCRPTSVTHDQHLLQILHKEQLFNVQKSADRYALMKDKSVVEIQTIVLVATSNEPILYCRKFTATGNFFTYPCDSAHVHILKVSGLSSTVCAYNCNEIQSKCLVVKRKSYYVAMPLIHS